MQYSKTLKQQVFEKSLLGFSTDEIHALFPIPKTTIENWKGRWKKDIKQHTVSDLPMPMIGTLILECEKAHKQLLERQKELELIHNSKVLQLVPKINRLEIALSFDKQVPKDIICHALEIPLSSLYRNKNSHKSFSETVRKQLQKELLNKQIQEIFVQSGCRFGSEKIRIALHAKGIYISKKRIIRLMKEMGLTCKRGAVAYYEPSEEPIVPEGENVQIL